MGIDFSEYYLTGNIKTNKRGKYKKSEKIEEKLAFSIAKILKFKYNHLIWRFDVGADLNLTVGSAVKNKRLQMNDRGYPDLFIAQKTNTYGGLYVELKKSREEIYRKNGDFRENKHLQEQLKMHKRLRLKGYKVVFCWSVDDFIKILDNYLKGE